VDVSPSPPGRHALPAELAAGIYWILTLATALRFFTEVMVAFWPSLGLKPLITLGGLGQLLAACLFVVNMWSRVRAPSIPREL
jgi:hypothetical protein